MDVLFRQFDWLIDDTAAHDYTGQDDAYWFEVGGFGFAVIASYILGYWTSSFRKSMVFFLFCTAVITVVTLFPWRCWRRNPVNWTGLDKEKKKNENESEKEKKKNENESEKEKKKNENESEKEKKKNE
eukprot:Trichotokara_eunicae@DN4417_c0_g1_i2.p1